ncbi:MAG TPA: hypothetical protein VHP33_24895, partial [Polyangiaceae bacterium]|nr:hypothetical protein [Polyangiaceae bacterium]
GDNLSMNTVAAALSAKLGKPITFVSLPIEAVRQNSADMAAMLEWFEAVGYSADIPALDAEFGKMLSFEAWLKKLAV